ncbi:MAG: DNA polymerase [Bifidobacterium breve]|nr:DNA polymerase [Bifidobacterium breve]
MKERRVAATDGATLLTDDGMEPLTATAIIRLTMLDHHTRVWCAHGWQDIKPIAAELLKRLPLQSNPAKDGVWGTFNIRGHFYSFRVRMGGITVDFVDVRNITRDDGLNVSRKTFGGGSDLETTWNIAQECAALHLRGTTIASMAMTDYIDGDYGGFKRHFPPLSKEVYHRMRPAYYGAIVYGKPGEYRDCRSWDVNSLYPSIMRDAPMPVGPPIWYDGKYQYDPDYPLHIDVIAFDAKLKTGKTATLTNILPVWGYEGERLDSTLGVVTMPVTDVDWETLTENYKVHVWEHVGGWKFRKSHGLYYTYVDKWFHVKQTATGERRQMAKLLLNSLVGKFGASLYRPMLHPKPSMNGGVDFTVDKPESANSLAWLPTAAYVNAYGRQTLSRAMNANAGRVLYSDTDGMILEGSDTPAGIETDDRKLGAWKNDHTYERLRILGNRKYCGVETDGDTVMRLSGVHRAAPIPYDEFLPGSRHFNDDGHTFML